MAGSGAGFGGFNPHLPHRGYVLGAKAFGAITWFWIFYRARQDGPVLLGWRHPWEGHEHGHEEHNGEHH